MYISSVLLSLTKSFVRLRSGVFIGENNVEAYYWSDSTEVAFYWEEATDAESRVHSYKAYLVRQADARDGNYESSCSKQPVAWLGGEEKATYCYAYSWSIAMLGNIV